jgi:adenylate cyclase
LFKEIFNGRGAKLLGFLFVLLVASILWPIENELDVHVLDAQFGFNRTHFPHPIAKDIVLVGINEQFIESVDEPLALYHQYLADFLRAASLGGAVVIGMDIVLPEKRFDTIVSTKNPQMDFHRILLQGLIEAQQRSKLVVAKVWDSPHQRFSNIQIDYASVLNMQDGPMQAIASADFCEDPDRHIRRYPVFSKACPIDGIEVTLGSEMSAAMGVRQPWSGLINYQLGDNFQYLPIQDVLQLATKGDEAGLQKIFSGKAVLIGTVDDDADMVDLPVPLAQWRPTNTHIPGVLSHAQEIRTMLNGGFIQPATKAINWACCFAFALFWFHRSIVRKMLVLLISMAAVVVTSNVALRHGYWLAPTAMLCTGTMAWGARTTMQAWQYFGERKRLKKNFTGHVSPEVLKQIIDGSLDANRAGTKVEVCVMFSDIRNFTTISEAMKPEAVVSLLNQYFSKMTAIVHTHGGTVDKFIGDGMMAFFGAPNSLPCPEECALDAAREMLSALHALNQELQLDNIAPLKIGIGLHSGDAVIGYIGSDERHEYTAIGDTVNIASRLEGLCKELRFPVICSATVALRLPDHSPLEALGKHAVKGHSPVSVYGWKPETDEVRSAYRDTIVDH